MTKWNSRSYKRYIKTGKSKRYLGGRRGKRGRKAFKRKFY